MQTHRPAFGAGIPVVEPMPGADEYRHLRIVALIDEPGAWHAATARLFACGRRRWRARTDVTGHPGLYRWAQYRGADPEIPEQVCLRAMCTSIAAGREIAARDPLHDFAAAITLLSGCPAGAVARSGAMTDPVAVRFSVYGFRDDDLPLAEDLITTTIDTCGAVVARRCAVVRRAPVPAQARPAADRAQPRPDLLVLGATAAR
ncbi:hypothetical protein [Nocardia rhizosphaerae]|uniref:Uncharacterized protein n=1 Tax=Nocardia rhizosphaerae TaxID=1691571 RepID=A0ABV8LEI5_9NOCA